MQREIVTPRDEAHWLAMRAENINSTETAALFGCSPYSTEYELHLLKRGDIESDFKANERMIWGNRLEAAIAYGIAEDHGLVVEPFKQYIRLPELRMGSSFDFKIVGIVPGWSGDNTTFRDLFMEHGPGIMEVKNVDGLQFKRGWIAGEEAEAPPHIEFQVQHQLEVCGLGWSIVAPLVGGNRPVPFFRLRDMATGNIIRQKIASFWRNHDAGVLPEPDYTRDGDAIARLYLFDNGQTIDLTKDERLTELCMEYKAAGADEKAAKSRKDAAKAEILTIIEHAKKVFADGFTLSAGTVAGGEVSVNRPAYTRLTITANGFNLTESLIKESSSTYTREPYRGMRITEPK